MVDTSQGSEPTLHRTLDPAEVARFGALAAKWWDTSGEFRPLHLIGPARLAFVRREVMRHTNRPDRGLRPFAGLSILDVGSGGGLVSEPLARLGATVTGIDPAPDNVAAATAHAAAQGLQIRYLAERLEVVVGRGERFDVTVCLEVLEHIPDPRAFVRLLSEATTPGGLAILSTINRTAASYALAIVGAEHVLRWLPPGTHQWDRFVTPDELAAALQEAGLTPQPAQGLVFDPLDGAWRLGTDTQVNYLMAAVRSEGLDPV